MRPGESNLAQDLRSDLDAFSRNIRPLPGITNKANLEALVEQMVESIRRIRFVSVIDGQALSPLRADPASDIFDPLRAAVLRKRSGLIEEAFWLVFLSVHFGKSSRTGWRLVRDIYRGLGGGASWDWTQTSANPTAFSHWLSTNYATLKGGDGIRRQFGNHRKYETLDPSSLRATGKVVCSYVDWVLPPRSHQQLVQDALSQSGGDGRKAFDYLYRSMNKVISFGRTARFDYLTMLGKLGLAAIEAGSAYMTGATGPLKGARLLFGGNPSAALSASGLDAWLIELEAHMSLSPQGMQVLEDALCNWQKSPGQFLPFRS